MIFSTMNNFATIIEILQEKYQQKSLFGVLNVIREKYPEIKIPKNVTPYIKDYSKFVKLRDLLTIMVKEALPSEIQQKEFLYNFTLNRTLESQMLA